jgi:predicted ATPase
VTFLFTDVEGSTRRWEADADAMRVALAAHDAVLRTAIKAHGGFIFKHTGDGVCAAFASPKAAADAAVDAQLTLELPVRMGLATGEAELRDGDYFGAVLNRAARVMAAGHGGQILVTDSTAGLLSGVDLIDLGPRRLRDVPMPVGVFQVRAGGLREEFPPLRALDTTPGNLRSATTSLIGRESEVAEIEAAVKAHRLVTLTGVGGVGKTRLALDVAARLTDEFPDGVWVFELAAVTDPAAVPDAVAAVLGITQQPRKSVSESVAVALEGRVRLLVIDNCEHVLDAAADLIDAILTQSATVRVLATSREGLGVADEQLWRVPSLDVNSGNESAAVNLFVERAQSVESDFSLAQPGEMDAAVDICRRLDGIPLAIELAASRMASMTATEMRDRLDHRFRLLVGSRRGLERHHTLRHAVGWSYDLLDDAAKMVLDRCSVFAGGFDLQSACAVAGSDDSDDYAILDLLDALVRKSLVLAGRSGGRTRYSMLETIRQFAEEQLVASGAAEDIRTAHARYFAGKEADIMALWDSPRQREAYAWLTVELANLRTAFRWAADHNDLDTAVGIAVYATFLGYYSIQHEPMTWAEQLIEQARAVEHRRLAQLYVMAGLCFNVGRIDDAIVYSDTAQMLIASGRFDPLPDEVEALVGGVGLVAGHPERYVALCRDRIAREPGNTVTRAALVMALIFVGARDEAVAASEGLLGAADATNNPRVACFALFAHGMVWRDANPVAAYETLRRGLTIAQETHNRLLESWVAEALTSIAARHGDATDAFDYITLVVQNYHDSGTLGLLPSPLANLALLFDRLGVYEPAATIVGFAHGSTYLAALWPEITSAIAHLRDVLGEATYESLARKGRAMTTAAIVAYAYDQIDQVRAELEAVSK